MIPAGSACKKPMASKASSQGISLSLPIFSINFEGRPSALALHSRSTICNAFKFPLSSPINALVATPQILSAPSSCDVVVFNNIG